MSLKPGQKRARNLHIGDKVWIDAEIVTLTNVVNRWSGGGLGCTDLYYDGGKSGGASERIISLAPDGLCDCINGLELD